MENIENVKGNITKDAQQDMHINSTAENENRYKDQFKERHFKSNEREG